MNGKILRLHLLLLIIVVALSQCRQKTTEQTSPNVDGTPQQVEIPDVLTGYINLKDALVATDFDAAKKAAEVFKVAVTGKIDAGFETAINSVTDKIIEATAVEDQRIYFEQVSTLMYALAENGQFEGQKLYKQFCPMAFDNKGAYWLSLDENILNPYFGDKMLKCGYVEEVL